MRFLYIAILVFCSLSLTFAQQQPTSCGTSDEALPQEVIRRMAMLPTIMQQQKARSGAGEMNICRISVEIDHQTYLKFEKDTNLIYQQVHEDILKVSEVYEKEINTRMVVTSIRIFKKPETDPFAVTYDIFQLIDILANMAPAKQDFDKRVYLFTKTVMGAGGVGNLDGKTSVSPLGNPEVIMHEFGHNFASPHTHNCNWPGGPIDFCWAPEGDCYDKALEALQDRSATIMSYCTRELTFHPLSQALMRDHADRSFSKIQAAPVTPEVSANAVVSAGDFFFWQPSPSALSYEITYAANSDFSNSKTVSVPFSGFQLRGIGAGSSLFAKVRAINNFGTSSWSQPVAIKIGSGKLVPPEINTPAIPPIFQRGTVLTLSYSSVPGATSYEVQITNPADALFQSPYFRVVSTTSEVQYNAQLPTMLKWRVRAINEQAASNWSEPGFFSVNPSQMFPLSVPFYRNAPRTFPFSYNPPSSYTKVRVSVADNRDFSHPIFMKEYTHVGPVTDVVSNLPSNSNLFFRVETWNENDRYYPKVKIADYTFDFSTTNSTLPAGLTILSPLAPDVFNFEYPKIALTSGNVWLTSRSKGFVRLDQKDLTYQVFNRNNTNGLLGYSELPSSLQVDDSLKIQVLSSLPNTNFLRVELPDDRPSNPGLVSRLDFTGFIAGYNTSHRLYWSGSVVYRETDNKLVPLKTFEGGWSIRKVIVMSGKAWILTAHYDGRGEITVIDPVSGSETERINSSTRPALLAGINSFALGPDGKIMILQYDPGTMGNRISLWDKQAWTTLGRWDPLVSGGFIQSIATSPTGEFYAMAAGEQTRILKYNGSKWEKIGADIPLREFTTNMEIDASDNIWLTGLYGLAKLALAKFDIVSTDKLEYCANDVVAVTMKVPDQVTAAKKFTAILTKPDGETASIADLGLQNGQISFKIPEAFVGKDVDLKVKTTGPEMYAPTSLLLNIRALPTAKISIDKSELVPLTDTATVTIELTGEKPWAFSLSNQNPVSTVLPVYKMPFTLSQPTDVELGMTSLMDRYCANNAPGNAIRITANLITGIAEPSWPKVSIYPNPSSDRILIQYAERSGKPSFYHISDIQSNIVASMQIREKLTEWDISKLSAGTYVLWTVHNGHKRSWKIVKN